MHAAVAGLLCGVVAIARSPSSAIGVVAELRSDGPYTSTMLSVTMVTDLVVIVLFTAAIEVGKAALSPSSLGVGVLAARFLGRTVTVLLLSSVHAVLVANLCLLTLSISCRPSLARPLALLLVGGFAFVADDGVRALFRGSPLGVRLEPLLSCIGAGFVITNGFASRRRAFHAQLYELMPSVLCFFFVTVGCATDFGALAETWPIACALFGARLASIRIGYAAGCSLAPDAPAAARLPHGWLGYITQAGVSLGLAEELGALFPGWGDRLRSAIVASIVINQIVGPPLLRLAIRRSDEAGRSTAYPTDKIAEQLTKRVDLDPRSLAAVIAAASAAAAAVAASATGRIGGAQTDAAKDEGGGSGAPRERADADDGDRSSAGRSSLAGWMRRRFEPRGERVVAYDGKTVAAGSPGPGRA